MPSILLKKRWLLILLTQDFNIDPKVEKATCCQVHWQGSPARCRHCVWNIPFHILKIFLDIPDHTFDDVIQPSHPLSPSVFPSNRDVSCELALRIKCPTNYSFSSTSSCWRVSVCWCNDICQGESSWELIITHELWRLLLCIDLLIMEYFSSMETCRRKDDKHWYI